MDCLYDLYIYKMSKLVLVLFVSIQNCNAIRWNKTKKNQKSDFSRTASLTATAHGSLDLSHGTLASILDKSNGERRGVILGDVTLLFGLLHALPS